MSIELSEGTLERLLLLFVPHDQARASEMLRDRCGADLPMFATSPGAHRAWLPNESKTAKP
jgi:hypothetical protein